MVSVALVLVAIAITLYLVIITIRPTSNGYVPSTTSRKLRRKAQPLVGRCEKSVPQRPTPVSGIDRGGQHGPD